MVPFVHLIMFISAGVVVWYFSGILISAVDKLARRYNKSGFVVAFFVLGFLTSISEISVAVNATIDGVPQVSVGNLIGASFVILLLIIPVLAIVGNGIKLQGTLTGRNLFIALVVILLPSFMVMDGNVTFREGMITLLAYLVLLFAIRNQPKADATEPIMESDLLPRKHLVFAFAQVVAGAVSIFVAGHILVEETTYFADLIQVPKSLIGLVLLGFGTNIPEIVIAVRAFLEGKQGIAFGDYLGSTATNTATFALLSLANGPFMLEASEFVSPSILLAVGLVLFFIFARSKSTISRREGLTLVSMYVIFLCVQLYHIVRFIA